MESRLYLGTRRYSSWSLRAWLAVRLAGLPVEEIVIPLRGGNTPAVKQISPSGTVPLLVHDGAMIWDSLAIGESCAELAPDLWPQSRPDRARARSIVCEMHAGFRALRQAMPMNLGRDRAGPPPAPDVLADIARIEAIWNECLTKSGGPFLFGAFTLADAAYAPVVARLLSYHARIDTVAQGYAGRVRAHPLMQEWYRLAMQEPAEWREARFEDLA